MSKSAYRIGELASEFEMPVETIRYFEREGLMPAPARSDGNYRLYDGSHRDRLRFIVHCRSLDMNHVEIRRLLQLRDNPEQNCKEVNTLLDEHIEHVTKRIVAMQAMRKQLRAMRAQCSVPGEVDTCGILNELSLLPVKTATAAAKTHPKVAK